MRGGSGASAPPFTAVSSVVSVQAVSASAEAISAACSSVEVLGSLIGMASVGVAIDVGIRER
jgi:hypothetical protein